MTIRVTDPQAEKASGGWPLKGADGKRTPSTPRTRRSESIRPDDQVQSAGREAYDTGTTREERPETILPGGMAPPVNHGPAVSKAAAPAIQFCLLLYRSQFVHHLPGIDGEHRAAGRAAQARRRLNGSHGLRRFLPTARARDIHQGGRIDVVGHGGESSGCCRGSQSATDTHASGIGGNPRDRRAMPRLSGPAYSNAAGVRNAASPWPCTIRYSSPARLPRAHWDPCG